MFNAIANRRENVKAALYGLSGEDCILPPPCGISLYLRELQTFNTNGVAMLPTYPLDVAQSRTGKCRFVVLSKPDCHRHIL